MPFAHERLDVYQASLDFLVLADGIIEGLPRGRGHLAVKLARAATSIVLNSAEGSGKSSESGGRRTDSTSGPLWRHCCERRGPQVAHGFRARIPESCAW